MNIKKISSRLRWPQTGAVYGIVGLIICFSLMSDRFFTAANFENIIHQAAVICIIAICSFQAVLTKQMDLSVGGIAGFAGVIAVQLFNGGMPLAFVYLICIAVGLAFGLFNGILAGYTKISPFIITLGTMGIAESLGMVVSGGTLRASSETFTWLDTGSLWIIPIPALIVMVLYLILSFVLKTRPYGIKMYAVGGREESAWASGINVKKIKMSVFINNGMLSAVAGLLLASRLNSANPSQGIGLELDGICSAVLGGTALTGGRGSIWGALLGALALSILRNGLNMIGLSSALQMMVIGFILILILTIDVLRRGEE